MHRDPLRVSDISPTKVEVVTNLSSPFDTQKLASPVGFSTPLTYTRANEISPQALLRSAAKSFPSTPSILRKRTHQAATTPVQALSAKKNNIVLKHIDDCSTRKKLNALENLFGSDDSTSTNNITDPKTHGHSFSPEV